MVHSSAQIFTKFDDDSKKRNIEGLEKTYLGVLLSIELNSKTSKNSKKIKEKIESLLSGNKDEINGKVTIGEREIGVTLTKKEEGIYNVKFDESASSSVDIKDTKDYTDEDLLTLCAQHELTINKDEKGNYHYSVTIKGKEKSATVGGLGKIVIFPQHLSYIKETIEHLKEGKSPTKEFALATGTGKTFIELLVEYLPARLMGVPYISLAPNEDLVTQKRDDWKKVLSDSDIEDIELKEISDNKVCSILSSESLIKNWDQFLGAIGLEQLPDIIKALNIGDKEFKIKNGKINIDEKDFLILADKIQFGDKEYKIQDGKVTINNQEFELNIEKSISLSFDEEHRVAEQELCKHRMGLLSVLMPTLFLSATPSISTHKYIKENDGLLKTLSLTDKMKSGVYGDLNLQVHTKVKSKNLAKEYSNGVEEYVDFKPEEKDKYNNANLTDDELKKEVENYLYRNVQSVIGEPALILAESNKQIENLKKILQYGRNETLPRCSSSKILNFLERKLSFETEYKLVTKSKKFALITEQVAKRFNITKEKASKIVKECYDFSGIADYSAFRVMHGIIENTLSGLTGLNRHELDEKRCADLKGLAAEVKAALDNNYDLEIYVKDQGIKGDKLKKELVQQMQSVINVLKENKGSDLFIRLIRNWNQDKKLHLLMPSKELEEVPKKLVDLLVEGNDAVVRDYLEYYGVEESKIDEFCQLSKKVSAERTEFINSLRGFSDQEQYELARSTPLGGNEKKLLDELGEALGVTLENRDELAYIICKIIYTYKLCSNTEYKCNKEQYPLKELRDFCYENKYKVKLVMLDSSANLSTEDLKSKLSDYISGQPLEELELVKKKLSLSDNQSVCEDLNHAKELKKARTEKDDFSINYHKKRILEDLNQKQLAKLVIDNLSAAELKDLYENLLKEEKDYHALCRMGLVGNDVNPTKVQGYNDINLQHVGMLIDPTSTDLNKPAQLIQAPGRLRCLNSNRHSTFFCYSSGELSFDINLLKKGDYIEAYNKSVVRLSNQQAYGNKLATEIIDYINRKIKSLKRIDDLADQSIQIALNSFIEVYNTNGHDFNKSKKEFIDVLKHARRKLNNYEKELRDNCQDFGMKTLNMLLKALMIVEYLFNRFTYYLETRSTYNYFLKKVNRLKSDPNVDTYAHVVAEYSVKSVTEINLLSEKFNEVYQQRKKPQNETDTKSFNNYLEHMSACLKHPVYLKLFDKITSPLMKGDYLIKLLDQIYPGKSNQDKVESLRKFRKNLKDKSFQFTKDDLRDIEQVRSYLQSIIKRIGMYNNHYYRVEECDTSIIPNYRVEECDTSIIPNYRVEECDTSIIPTELLNNKVNGSFHFQESKKLRKHREKYIKLQQSKAKIACESDLNELEILSQRENIKLAKEAADYVISPLLGYSSRTAKNKQISEEDKEVINGVVAKAGEIKNDLEKNVKPSTTEEIISPSTEFINPIAKLREKVLRRVGR
ncbi:DEAD/DEAH box helicase family protein [Wolbachia endosymbiont (group B) of Athalia cordata]|uniref:DEAD/DEAH box helicase family protein n=1 Tax=Wolbachia endosymbiont (group B) of Athalia cordata TaxID=2953986 RepID=UPI00223014C7|nr:DEAD/DEAH box helicase family protein [Wolbachia endosymbiont (group B) of Athalia cordata]